jgi:tetratricopeptide (TPR) repeat protein
MKRFFYGVLFLLVFSNVLFARDIQTVHQNILRSLENGEYAAAVAELQELRKTDRKIFELNNYDYLLARAAERYGDFALAAAVYQTVAARGSVLRPYALFHLAEIARSSGNFLLERVYLQELSASVPESLLNEAAEARLIHSYFESKNFEQTIAMLENRPSGSAAQTKISNSKAQKPKTKNTASRLERENLVLLGESLLRTGQAERAKEVFKRLIDELPNAAQPDDFALAAARGLDLIDGGAEGEDRTAPALPENEHLKRAEIYQFNRDFSGARRHYEAIVENYPASAVAPNAFYQIGRGFALEGDFSQAVDWFERAFEKFPDSAVAEDALSQAASAYARMGKTDEAVSLYQKLIEKFPDGQRVERAYLNIVDALRDAGKTSDALEWTRRAREKFAGKLTERIALFAGARIRLSQSDWPGALNDLDKLLTFEDLGGARVPGGATKNEIAFLRAFALEQMNRYAEAVDAYLSVPDGRAEYYGWRATERLKALARNESAKSAVEQKLELLKKNIDETRSVEARRRAATDALRLTEDAEQRRRLLEILKTAYAELPDYRNMPQFELLEFGRKNILQTAPVKDAGNRHKTIADELLFLGLYDEAAPELEESLKDEGREEDRRQETGDEKRETGERRRGEKENNEQKSTNNEQRTTNNEQSPKTQDPRPKTQTHSYTLAVFYKRGDTAHRAAQFIEPVWRRMPADFQLELIPRDQIELLYPAPYRDALVKYAPPRTVDPRFALSIMRQESRFRADVKSVAAARGLMQFISSTSDRIARQLGRENFRQDELYDPPTAVLFGSEYLGTLFREFPGQPEAVAAGYNGGEDNMARWLARSRSDQPDRYVSEIAFAQTKDYVYKVMANYRVYRFLYDENLKPKTNF